MKLLKYMALALLCNSTVSILANPAENNAALQWLKTNSIVVWQAAKANPYWAAYIGVAGIATSVFAYRWNKARYDYNMLEKLCKVLNQYEQDPEKAKTLLENDYFKKFILSFNLTNYGISKDGFDKHTLYIENDNSKLDSVKNYLQVLIAEYEQVISMTISPGNLLDDGLIQPTPKNDVIKEKIKTLRARITRLQTYILEFKADRGKNTLWAPALFAGAAGLFYGVKVGYSWLKSKIW